MKDKIQIKVSGKAGIGKTGIIHIITQALMEAGVSEIEFDSYDSYPSELIAGGNKAKSVVEREIPIVIVEQITR